jgi:alcohol dehydrogenase class IV
MANTYRYTPLERVYWDTPAVEVILKEVEQRDLKRVFVVSSSTLSKETEEINKIKKSLEKSL